jgi:sugar lactone lactonase YvrE
VKTTSLTLLLTILSAGWLGAASIYEPYTFTTFAGGRGSGNADGTGVAAFFNQPKGVATDSSGNVYVADAFNSTVRQITPAGVVTTLAGDPGGSYGSADGTGSAARFKEPSGIATDLSGNIYVADTVNNTIRKITPAGVVTTLAGLAGSSGSADGTGNAARFNTPVGIATDSSGNVYVADSFNSTIRQITPAGVVTTFAGLAGSAGSSDGTGSAARFGAPSGVATDSSGNVYATDNQTIRKITPAGVVTTLAGLAGSSGSSDGSGSAARFVYPDGIATDSSGNVYVTTENFTIRKITPAGVVTTLAGLAGSVGGSFGTADGTGSVARFNFPFGIATDSSGNVYVADSGNNAIRKGVPGPVPSALAASYNGLFYENDQVRHAHSGYFSFNMSTNRAFRASMLIEGGSYLFTGTFDANYAAIATISRTPNTTLTVSLQLVNNGGNYQVTGNVTDGTWTADLLGDRAYYSAAHPAALAGKYSIAFWGDSDGTSSPSYGSSGVVTVSSAGGITLSGTMSDAAAIAQTTSLSKSGHWPFYVKLYGGKGSLLGWVTFNTQPTYKLTANVNWIKTAASGNYYTLGFTNALTLYGGSARHP